MRDVYACRLPIDGNGATAYARLCELLRKEVADGEEMPGESGTVVLAAGTASWHHLSAAGTDDRVFKVRLDRPALHQPDLMRSTAFTVTLQAGNAALVVHEVLRPIGARVMPVRPATSPPPLVGVVVDSMEVVEDEWQILRQPAFACNSEGAAELAELLLSPTRVLPVVVVTADSSGFHVDPDDLAEGLVGLAHVTVLETPVVSSDLVELLGPALGVFGGSLRLYWPGLTLRSDPRDHPFWGPSRLTDPPNRPFDRVLRQLLVPAMSFRITTAALEDSIRQSAERAKRVEIERNLERARSASLRADWQEELERAWTTIDRQARTIEDLTEQLRVERENVRAIVAYGPAPSEGAAASDAVAEVAEPSSLLEAITWASQRCPHLVILDAAVESARKATYRQPGRFWRALLAIEEVAAAWADNELGSGPSDAFADRGFDYRANVSQSTVGRWRHQYERTYEGATVTLGPHLALGRGSPEACARIYWYRDEERKVFVIGHAGNHLVDKTTG